MRMQTQRVLNMMESLHVLVSFVLIYILPIPKWFWNSVMDGETEIQNQQHNPPKHFLRAQIKILVFKIHLTLSAVCSMMKSHHE